MRFFGILFIFFIYMNSANAQLDSIWFNNYPLPVCQWGSFLHQSFFSEKYQKNVGYCVYLPSQYDVNTAKKYPVIYWLHGATGNETTDVGMSWHFYDRMRKNLFPECIIVFANGFDYSYWHNDYVVKTGDTIDVNDLLVHELIPFIDKSYRTINDKYARAIVGFSMGGYGAMRTAIENNIFSSCTAIDSGIWQDGKESEGFKQSFQFDSTAIRSANLQYIVSKNYDSLSSTFFYFITSEMGPEAHTELSNRFNDLGVKHDFEIIPRLLHSPAPFFKKRSEQIAKYIQSHFILPELTARALKPNLSAVVKKNKSSQDTKKQGLWQKFKNLFK